ncbi:MAG: Mrp/NBP35 family ATP-binding protein [bacterium]
MGTGSEGESYVKMRESDDRDARIYMSLKKIRKKFLVMSGKGGVGKTSVSVNLALALANRGLRVGLIDVDIHGPDVPRMLGLKDKIKDNIEQRMIPLHYNENLQVVSIESMIADGNSAVIWRGPIKNTTIKRFLGDVEWGELDYLIIDSPPGTGDEPLTIAQNIRDAQAIVVTTPQEVALADVRKSINFCRQMNMDIFGIVENMSGLDCPHCGKRIDLFGKGGGEKTAQNSNCRFLGKIPFDAKLVVCGDHGISFQEKYADTAVSKAFQDIADKLIKY